MDKKKPKIERPDKFQHYLNRAKIAAERSTCIRRKIGAIIVKNDVVISSGYVGSPRKMDNCIDQGNCMRIDIGIPSGQRYELCRSVHAEQNAIINAARSGANIFGGEMYISSKRIENGYSNSIVNKTKIYGPCLICKKEIINAGLKDIHMREEGVGHRTYTIEQLKKDIINEEEEIKIKYKRNKKAFSEFT